MPPFCLQLSVLKSLFSSVEIEEPTLKDVVVVYRLAVKQAKAKGKAHGYGKQEALKKVSGAGWWRVVLGLCCLLGI